MSFEKFAKNFHFSDHDFARPHISMLRSNSLLKGKLFIKNFRAKTICLISLGVFRHLSLRKSNVFSQQYHLWHWYFHACVGHIPSRNFCLMIYLPRTHKSEKNIYFSGEIEMTGIKRKRKLSDLNSSEDGFQRMARMMRMDFKGGRAWYLITGAEHLNQGNLL